MDDEDFGDGLKKYCVLCPVFRCDMCENLHDNYEKHKYSCGDEVCFRCREHGCGCGCSDFRSDSSEEEDPSTFFCYGCELRHPNCEGNECRTCGEVVCSRCRNQGHCGDSKWLGDSSEDEDVRSCEKEGGEKSSEKDVSKKVACESSDEESITI